MDGLVVILLAAGTGKRMNSKVAKQYMEINGKPVLWYALQAFSACDVVSHIVLVVGAGEEEYVQREIVARYAFSKVSIITEGGSERYFSVWNGLKAAWEQGLLKERTYIAIHDGARPLVTEQIIRDTYEAAKKYRACVAAMPVKDTIKIGDDQGFAVSTPRRDLVWTVQTPQTFEGKLIYNAYQKLMEELSELTARGVVITDDAMVVEHMTGERVKLVRSSYENIKITTPEDLILAQGFLDKRE